MRGPAARSLAAAFREEQKTLLPEIVQQIRSGVPEFSRPLSGPFAAGITRGVGAALEEFAELVEHGAGTGARAVGPADGAAEGAAAGPVGGTASGRSRVYRDLGRGELAEGRTLDALQSAYRLGARVAWHRYARVARRAGAGGEEIAALAEAAFAHVHAIASASEAGYREAQTQTLARVGAASLARERALLAEALLTGAAPDALAAAAEAARWPLPPLLCVVALAAVADDRAAGRGGREPLPDAVLDGSGQPEPYLIVPQPTAGADASAGGGAPDTVDPLRLSAAGGGWRGMWRGAVVGPAVPPEWAGASLRWARALRDRRAAAVPGGRYGAAHGVAVGDGVQGLSAGRSDAAGDGSASGVWRWDGERGAEGGPVRAEDHLVELLLTADEELLRLLCARRLAPLAGLTPLRRERLAATALAYLESGRGAAAEVAARLGVHPQTARRRLRQVQLLLGPALADASARFELEAALRYRALTSGSAGSAAAAGR